MEFFSIVSGSSGNALYVGSNNTHLLVDAGLSGKRIEEGLNTYDLTCDDLDGILISHEHTDHISGLGVLARRYGLPIYLSRGTRDEIIRRNLCGKVDTDLFQIIEADMPFTIGDIEIEAMRISHDAAQPLAYTMSCDDSKHSKMAIVTDLGEYNDYIKTKISDIDVMLLEANHDINMLQCGAYPYSLKRRILGEEGHLSNEACGKLLCEVLHDNVKKIYLGHLSNENNYPELALQAVKAEIGTNINNPYGMNDFDIEVARRDRVSSKIEF